MDNIALFADGTFIFRWIHFIAGIIWIGLLYYFNFVQGSFFNETDANTKKACVQKLVPRALWWFRWGAMVTFLTGWIIIGMKSHGAPDLLRSSWGVNIITGAVLGSFMWFNVWFVIWPAQKNVIAAASGQTPTADPAASGAKAALASRTNTLFSIPLLFFMGAASHLPLGITEESNLLGYAITSLIIIAALQFNALKGQMGPMKTVRGVLHSGLALTGIFYVLLEIFK